MTWTKGSGFLQSSANAKNTFDWRKLAQGNIALQVGETEGLKQPHSSSEKHIRMQVPDRLVFPGRNLPRGGAKHFFPKNDKSKGPVPLLHLQNFGTDEQSVEVWQGNANGKEFQQK